MVVTEQMKQSVEDQVGYLAIGRPPRRGGLPARGLEAQVDLAEEHGPADIEEIRRVREGEGEHVRRAIDLAVVPIQPANERVVAENDGHARARPSEEAQRLAQERLKSCRS